MQRENSIVPEIKTARLVLSEFGSKDAAAVFAYASNPKVSKMVTWEPHTSISDSLAFIEFVSSKLSLATDRTFLAWAVRDPTKNSQAIGSISFTRLSSISGQIDYAIAVEQWSRGLMTEAAQAVRDWAFSAIPSLLRLQAQCLPDNFGSRRVMEKTGMQFEGVTRSATIVKKNPTDLATYAVLRADLFK